MAEATTRPWNRLDGVFAAILQRPLARRLARDARFTVPVCIILICGCFAAAALLQMRLDRSHALAQAATFERARAADRRARHRPDPGSLCPAGRGVRRFAPAISQRRSGPRRARHPRHRGVGRGAATAQARFRRPPTRPCPGRTLPAPRTSFPGGLAFRDGGRIIAVLFDPASLALGSHRTALVPRSDCARRRRRIVAAVPGWPLAVMTSVDENSALADWAQALPLYLFVILGPALVGGWLAALFVGAFERHARAARAIRALKSTRPIEAKLMVRLANAERGAMEALRSKSEFIAHMSHELRTPLNAVIGFSEIIAAGILRPRRSSQIWRICPRHRRCGPQPARQDRRHSGIRQYRGRPLSPAARRRSTWPALAAACVEEQQGRAFSRRISLSLAFGEPGEVRADSRAVRRILTNLLANALTYTAEGGIVRVDVRFEEGAGILTLSDSGMGFTRREARRRRQAVPALRPRRHGDRRRPGPGHRHGAGAAHGRRDAAGRRRPRRGRQRRGHGIEAAPAMSVCFLTL